MKERIILKNKDIYLNLDKGFLVAKVTEEERKALKAHCGVPDTEELLFTLSKFAKVEARPGCETESDACGNCLASVKIEAASYDWSYKGKKGHTDKWQVIAVLIKSTVSDSVMEGLDDD